MWDSDNWLTMMPTTRQIIENNLKRLLALARLTQAEQGYVVGEISTMEDMILINNQDGINEVLTDNDKLRKLKRWKVKEVAEYIRFYIAINPIYDGIRNTTENDWKNHLIRHFQWVQITTPNIMQSQTIYDMGSLFKKKLNHESMLKSDPGYHKKCEILYNLLINYAQKVMHILK